jgi:hypothetical protein
MASPLSPAVLYRHELMRLVMVVKKEYFAKYPPLRAYDHWVARVATMACQEEGRPDAKFYLHGIHDLITEEAKEYKLQHPEE